MQLVQQDLFATDPRGLLVSTALKSRSMGQTNPLCTDWLFEPLFQHLSWYWNQTDKPINSWVFLSPRFEDQDILMWDWKMQKQFRFRSYLFTLHKNTCSYLAPHLGTFIYVSREMEKSCNWHWTARESCLHFFSSSVSSHNPLLATVDQNC